MKDKLEKTGHRKRYYQLRYCVVAFLFGLTALAASAIPVGISIKLAEAEAQASEIDKTSTSSEEGTSEGEEPLLSLFAR